jgi:ribosome-associated protein
MKRVNGFIRTQSKGIKQRAVRASGSGSRNPRKEATAFEVRFDIPASSLPPEVKDRLILESGRHVTNDGVLVEVSRTFHSQGQNHVAALERLAERLKLAAAEPKERKPTRPRAKVRSKRREAKQFKSAVKRSRRGLDD